VENFEDTKLDDTNLDEKGNLKVEFAASRLFYASLLVENNVSREQHFVAKSVSSDSGIEH
jgi:hypothetical protein